MMSTIHFTRYSAGQINCRFPFLIMCLIDLMFRLLCMTQSLSNCWSPVAHRQPFERPHSKWRCCMFFSYWAKNRPKIHCRRPNCFSTAASENWSTRQILLAIRRYTHSLYSTHSKRPNTGTASMAMETGTTSRNHGTSGTCCTLSAIWSIRLCNCKTTCNAMSCIVILPVVFGQQGAGPSINQSGNSALACVLRHVRDWEFRYELLDMLLQHGGNPNVVGRDGSVPLMVSGTTHQQGYAAPLYAHHEGIG